MSWGLQAAEVSVMSRRATIAVALAALAGASLAAGVMWYRMTIDGFDYTMESWVMIVPIWMAPLLAAWSAQHRPLVGALLLMASSLVAAWYFSDVFGFAPAAVTFGVGLEHALKWTFGQRTELPA